MTNQRPDEPSDKSPTQPMDRDEWTLRCARRITEVDPDIPVDEARRIAADMQLVERLAAMDPEAAVDFVRHRLANEKPDKYERRSRSR